MFYHFNSMAEEGTDYITMPHLLNFVYIDCNTAEVQKALNIYDSEKITFYEYLMALQSVVHSSGSVELQLPMLIKLYGNDQAIFYRKTMEKMAEALLNFFYPPNNELEKESDKKRVLEVVKTFFSNKDSLDIDEFSRAVKLAESPVESVFSSYSLIQGFQLFDYIYTCAFRPIEEMTKDLTSCKRIYKEGVMRKNFDNGIYSTWNQHWCVLGAGFFWYYGSDATKFDYPERVIPLHNVSFSRQQAQSFCFQIEVPGYKRIFATATDEELKEWMTAVTTHKEQHPFNSFSPEREGTCAIWYIDGKSTYLAMAQAIQSAKKEIFITDWFFSPEVYMIREDENGKPKLNDEYRLDHMLKAKAEQGVKIYVLIWNETKIAVAINSSYAQTTLERLHTNIKVLRHPLVTPIAWSHHQKTLVIDQKLAFVGGLDLCFGRYDDHEHRILDPASQTWKGKDYYNPLYCPHTNCDSPFTDCINRTTVPRMGWHDIHMSLDGLAARDVACNFIQRWNYHKDALQSPYHYLAPSTKHVIPSGTSTCQVLRSVSDWSAAVGPTHTETSIYQAYLHHIQTARHYIYIENQFFVSSLAGGIVKNEIGLALLNRLRSAISKQEVFRLVILLPVHPDGTFKDSASTRWIMRWQYKTICKGGNSLLEQLAKDFPSVNLDNYVIFISIRKCAAIDDNIVTEQIYVHSKMILIDDEVAIIGSCNINDRSMNGDRDSEIAVLVKDKINVSQSTMNGNPFDASRFVQALRINLWKEHFGLTPEETSRISDPIASSTYDMLVGVMKNNTALYKKLFPDNKKVAENNSENMAIRNAIKGNAIEFDKELVAYNELVPSITDVDVSLVGDEVFT